MNFCFLLLISSTVNKKLSSSDSGRVAISAKIKENSLAKAIPVARAGQRDVNLRHGSLVSEPDRSFRRSGTARSMKAVELEILPRPGAFVPSKGSLTTKSSSV